MPGRGVVVEVARHAPRVRGEPLPDLLAERGAGVLLDRVAHRLRDVLVRPAPAGEADRGKSR
ncbi:hypothetical protein ACFYY3_21045 [Streptomyces sp. NPDC001812]|uniref:hypothetical protein n=1 Tax=unclassified Streptomyces TaxID=2593676 RepID=UPI00365804B0